MIKALVIAVEWITLNIQLSITSNRAERFRMLNKFDTKCSRVQKELSK